MERKQKTKLREFTREFYRGNKTAFFMAILETVFLVAANLMISWLMQVLIDATTGAEGAYTLGQAAMLCGACMLVLAAGFWLAYHSKPRFIAKASGQYKEFVFRKLSQKGISAFAGENTAFYLSALSNDANAIETDYIVIIFNLIDDVLLFLGALGLMLWYSPGLTAIGVALALLPVAASILAGDRVARAEKQVSETNERYMSTLNDCLTGFSVVKSFRAEAAMCRLFAQRVREVSNAKTLRRKTSIVVQALGLIAGCIAQLGVFLAGAWLVLAGYDISAGVLIAFVNLMNYVVNPIGTVPQYLAQYKAAGALIDKLAQALDTSVREEGTRIEPRLERGIEIQNLSFSYDGRKEVLHAISFRFEAGKSYAIVGGSGSGKSTLLNLLMAGYSDYSGRILLDGRELRTVSSGSLYELMSMVQQNVFIFNASIRDNITMFSDFPAGEVDRAMALSGLTELVAERGEHYLCGENGSGLSGGEKQRISIARSLLRRSRVLLVDEATAALDARTAYQVAGAILDLKDLTRIVVTHTLDEGLLKRYDCVLALKNGTVAESGSFGDLMEKKGYFYSLYTVSQ